MKYDFHILNFNSFRHFFWEGIIIYFDKNSTKLEYH